MKKSPQKKSTAKTRQSKTRKSVTAQKSRRAPPKAKKLKSQAKLKKSNPQRSSKKSSQKTNPQAPAYVEAKAIPLLVAKLLKLNPWITRRQIALLLQKELAAKKFSFSLNSLQFILAGKTQRTRAVVIEQLKTYAAKGELAKRWEKHKADFTQKKGRPSLEHRLMQAYSHFQETKQEIKKGQTSESKQHFLALRQEVIQKRWKKNFSKAKRNFSLPKKFILSKVA